MIDVAVTRLRERESGAIAVLVGGSYAKGTADELSDLDLTAIVEQDAGRYYTWFEEREGSAPLHISAGVAQRLSRPAHNAGGMVARIAGTRARALRLGDRRRREPRSATTQPSSGHPRLPSSRTSSSSA